jgi:hypothetical protein
MVREFKTQIQQELNRLWLDRIQHQEKAMQDQPFRKTERKHANKLRLQEHNKRQEQHHRQLQPIEEQQHLKPVRTLAEEDKLKN